MSGEKKFFLTFIFHTPFLRKNIFHPNKIIIIITTNHERRYHGIQKIRGEGGGGDSKDIGEVKLEDRHGGHHA